MSPSNPPRPFPSHPNEPASEPALAVETGRLRQSLRELQPEDLARRTGATYTSQGLGNGMLSLALWGAPVTMAFPELIARGPDATPLPLPVQALLVYYLTTSDGSTLVGDWVSFADLPGGRVYAQAFQGYSGNVIARTFGEDIEAFQRACLAAGGAPVKLSDAAFTFAALPRIPLLVTYWQGEEEFPSTSKILFDPTATNHLPIDVCAILGSMLVSKIMKAK